MTSTAEHRPDPTIILVPGYWLGAWAWDEVRHRLAAAGAESIALTLPGLDPADPDRSTRTLDDQAAAIQAAVTSASGDVVLVAHSGANGPVSLVMDRSPDALRRVVWVDSGPTTDDSAFAPDLPTSVVELPLPPFDNLAQQASLEGLAPDRLDAFRARAIPEPAGVARERIRLVNAARRQVPTTLICCSIASQQLLELAGSGHPMFAEVAELTDVEIVDLPTGHWPMWSRPVDLATAILAAARPR